MAYLAFYNKYRPQKFSEVVGQKSIVTTLENAIKEDKIAHAYLFCGPRGTGKTTMARLFAKALNCSEGLGHQCDECESCKRIIEGQHPDVIEIDAASNSTVDSVRQLIENVSYQPILSRYKIYIIDEVHNMSNSAFNALLKTIEEPPSFVIFILATTDPQKVLPTILSRVQRFDFSKVSDKDLIDNMKRVLNSETITYDEEALRLIASLSDGGVRDSLSLLDKVVSYSGSNVSIEDVNDLLGLLSRKDEIELINQISERKADLVLKTIQEKYDNGLDIRKLQKDLLNLYKDFLVYQITKDPSLLEFLNKEEVSKIKITVNEARNNIDTIIQSIRDNKLSDNLLTQFQLTLISLMSDKQVEVVKEVVQEKPKAKELTSKPVEVITQKQTFEAKANDEEISTDIISYTTNDLLYLAQNSDKETRAQFKAAWNKLEELFPTDYGYEARALFSCSPVIVANNILVVSAKFQMEIDKINKKNTQNKLVDIIQKCFGKSYHVLPITHDEVIQISTEYKKLGNTKLEATKIDFGKEKSSNASTDFFNELNNGI